MKNIYKGDTSSGEVHIKACKKKANFSNDNAQPATETINLDMKQQELEGRCALLNLNASAFMHFS